MAPVGAAAGGPDDPPDYGRRAAGWERHKIVIIMSYKTPEEGPDAAKNLR
jgi:hypothetical protein